MCKENLYRLKIFLETGLATPKKCLVDSEQRCIQVCMYIVYSIKNDNELQPILLRSDIKFRYVYLSVLKRPFFGIRFSKDE